MQVFVPLEDYGDSAATLDLSRLGKQIMESGQILRALNVDTYGWKNHPATKMWANNQWGLLEYTYSCAREWQTRRGKEHGAWTRIWSEFGPNGTIRAIQPTMDFDYPEWWGTKVHETHQSNLVRKDAEHYRKYFPDVPDDLEYHWPV